MDVDVEEDEKGGGMRRMRHHTLSKIINRLHSENEAIWYHVQS